MCKRQRNKRFRNQELAKMKKLGSKRYRRAAFEMIVMLSICKQVIITLYQAAWETRFRCKRPMSESQEAAVWLRARKIAAKLCWSASFRRHRASCSSSKMSTSDSLIPNQMMAQLQLATRWPRAKKQMKTIANENNNIIKKKRVQANYRRWILLEEAQFIAVTRLPDRPRSRRKK